MNYTDIPLDYGRISIKRYSPLFEASGLNPNEVNRRNHPHQTLPRRIRFNAYIPRSEQEIFHQILPQSRPYRRRSFPFIRTLEHERHQLTPYRRPKIFQTIRNRSLPPTTRNRRCTRSTDPNLWRTTSR